MPDIEHDMDDLLRKAADRYPLSTGTGNWDVVAAQLTERVPSTPGTNKKRKTGIALLFLLLFLFTSDIYLHQQSKGSEKSSIYPGQDVTTKDNDAFAIKPALVSIKNIKPREIGIRTTPADQED